MAIKTDLNDRERTRFEGQLRSLAAMATKAADGLRDHDDTEFSASLIILTLSMMGLKEMTEVVIAAAKKAREDKPDEFPSIIGG